MSKVFLGFDVGGTKIEAVILSSKEDGSLNTPFGNFEILFRERVATERQKGYEVILEKAADLANRALTEAGVKTEDLSAIGLGLPGSIHPKSGQMLNGNTMALVGKNLASDLQKKLEWDKPFFSENDANCFAVAEALCGVGASYKKDFSETIAVGIILGTGCGGGVVVNGRVLQGKNGGASEFGHVPLYNQGHPCYCGQRGCAEQYLSGPSLEALFASRQHHDIKDVIQAKDIFELAAKKEPIAVAVVKEYQKALALFLANLTTTFDPDYFVLGGGVSTQEMIYQGLEEKIIERTFLPIPEIDVFPSVLGDSSGVIGAALLPLIRI